MRKIKYGVLGSPPPRKLDDWSQFIKSSIFLPLIWMLCLNSSAFLGVLLNSLLSVDCIFLQEWLTILLYVACLSIQTDYLSLLFVSGIFIAIHVWLYFHVYSAVSR